MTFPKPCARLLIGVAMLGITALSTGCSLGVEPWERDLLARESMKMDGHIDDAIADHIYFSKEASTGGRGFGGGGCGCN